MKPRSSLLAKRHSARLAWLCSTMLAVNVFAGIEFENLEVKRQISPLEQEVVARFPFKNTGSSEVRITDMQSCCNCTKPAVAQTLYKPGESGEITITFEIGDRHGLQRKGVVVTTSDPTQSPVSLFIAAEIPEVITLSSPLLLWKKDEASAEKKLAVSTLPSAGIREVRARASSRALTVSVEQTGESRFNVAVTPLPSAKNLSETLLVEALLANGTYKRSTVYVRVR